jgi:hypothetical protein
VVTKGQEAKQLQAKYGLVANRKPAFDMGGGGGGGTKIHVVPER